MSEAKIMLNSNGQVREVVEADDFDFSTAKVGDLVVQEVVDNIVNCLPPAWNASYCTQLGEPYSHMLDDKSGAWRATYATFKLVHGTALDGIWEYCGNCFRGENTERGIKPVYI